MTSAAIGMTDLSPAKSTLRLYDSTVVFIAGALMTLGVVMVYSASVTVTGEPFQWREWWRTPLRQGAFAVAGFMVMLIAAHVDYRALAWPKPGAGWRVGVLALLALALLVAVLIPGVGQHAKGAQRALVIPGLGGLGFQPAELAKVVLVIWVSALLTRGEKGDNPHFRRGVAENGDYPLFLPSVDVRDLWGGFLPAALSAGLLIGLTGVEDFGTAALMGVVLLVLLVAGGARWTHIGLMGVVAAGLGSVLVLIEPYRIVRIRAYFASLLGAADTEGAGYQVHQAMLAMGSGGWWGRGLGAGVRKYGYLPQDNNDFILAIICEELGVVGGLVVVGLFLLLLWRGWRIAAAAPDRFGRLLALGLTLTICLQAAFNVGVVTNSIPTKGISLPFVSAGGSGVLFLGLAAGLLAAIGRQTESSQPHQRG